MSDAPIQTTVIDTGHDVTLPQRIMAETPGAAPNVVVSVIQPLTALVIRFINVFLTSLVGIMTAGAATGLIPASDFLDLLWKSATLCVAGAGIDLLKNLVTIFGRLESKYPLLTGNV